MVPMRLSSGILICLAGLASLAPADDLGVANNYNLFVLGNSTRTGSDVQGAVAIGGTARFSSHTVGELLPADPTRPALVVGGNLTYTGGDVMRGGIASGGNVSLTSMSVAGNVTAGGTVTTSGVTIYGAVAQNQEDAVPVDFVQAAVDLTSASTFWGSRETNGQVVNNWNTLFFYGSDTDLNVFTVTSALLGNCYGVNIIVPGGSTVLINVTGASGKMPNVGYQYSGADDAHVVFNFFEATKLNIGASHGAVFAPQAVTTFPYGLAIGTVVVKSFTGGGQINLAPFTGTLPGQGGYFPPPM
jgi:choice-of-anchor A domain-containing protein